MAGCLYIVPTPIGNLADITVRAREILGEVDLVAAEDTRHSRKLLSHLGVDTPMCAYHEHANETATTHLIERLCAGQSVALISDAGTPLMSDPGYRLVRAAQDQGVRVVPLPGPCAAITALSAAGLPTDRFAFEGFLPAKAAARLERLRALSSERRTVVFYEAPHRILETLEAMVTVYGEEREVALARELTKTFETVRRAALAEVYAWVAGDPNQQRGELVLMVGPAVAEASLLDTQASALLQRLATELPPRKAAAVVADICGLKARDVYAALMALKGSNADQ